jgi:hypothetical protein
MSQTSDLRAAADAIRAFAGSELTRRIALLERTFSGADAKTAGSRLLETGVSHELLGAAYALKVAAGEINVVIHVLGILLCLPHLLEPGERVEYLSLGAGNTGKEFDLETNLRIAEFKFIHWRRKSNVIRQNSLFKDLFFLAEHPTSKRKFMYVLDTAQPLKFLKGRRALRSVMSRHRPLSDALRDKYGDQFTTVGQYYAARGGAVILHSVGALLAELGAADILQDPDEEFAAPAT